MITEANVWVDELGIDQCWRLLERCSVGRLGFAAEAEQLILPVNYAVDGHSIVVRTGRTVMLEALGPGATVAFEVDGSDAVVGDRVERPAQGPRLRDGVASRRGRAAAGAPAVGVRPTRPLAAHSALVGHRPGDQSRPPAATRPLRAVHAARLRRRPTFEPNRGGPPFSPRSSYPSTSNRTVTAHYPSPERWREPPASRSSW